MSVMEIVGYVVAVLFNIGFVATVRARAYERGQEFLQSGRFATLTVWVLSFVQLLVVGRFEALQDSQALMELIQQASTLAAAAIGVHAMGKTLVTK